MSKDHTPEQAREYLEPCKHSYASTPRSGQPTIMNGMDRSDELAEQFNQVGVGFLLIEVDMGLTFLSVAATTANKETAIRNRENARLAYESVLRYISRIHFDLGEQVRFDEKFAELKHGLIEAGYRM